MTEPLRDFMQRFAQNARERLIASGAEVVLTQYIVYEHPRDYPQGYVVRAWHLVRGQTEPLPDPGSWKVATLDLARAVIPDGMVNVGRLPGDDATVLEVWT